MTQPEAADGAAALARACNALWLATLSLMTAFMQTQAPAHRLLLARRIARNLRTLQAQECFAPACHERFARLAKRWEGHAKQSQPQSNPGQGGQRLLDILRQLTHHTG
jgi:hypothetical protein